MLGRSGGFHVEWKNVAACVDIGRLRVDYSGRLPCRNDQKCDRQSHIRPVIFPDVATVSGEWRNESPARGRR
jgi:hypothetical protein